MTDARPGAIPPPPKFIRELVAAHPPIVWIGKWGVWILDERWRLPYRWYDLKVSRSGVALMLFGPCLFLWKPE